MNEFQLRRRVEKEVGLRLPDIVWKHVKRMGMEGPYGYHDLDPEQDLVPLARDLLLVHKDYEESGRVQRGIV
jgi:hypothetical protein